MSSLTSSLTGLLINTRCMHTRSNYCTVSVCVWSLLTSFQVKGTVSVYSGQEVAKNSTPVPVVNRSHTKYNAKYTRVVCQSVDPLPFRGPEKYKKRH